MSELNDVIETRLTAAQSSADAAMSAANAVGLNLCIGASPPSAPINGQLWSDTSIPGTAQLKVFNGSDWSVLATV